MPDKTENSEFSWLGNYPLLEQEPFDEYAEMVGPAAASLAIGQCADDIRTRLDTILYAADSGENDVLMHEIRIIHSLAETFAMRRLSEVARLIIDVMRLGRKENLPKLIEELINITKLSIDALEGFSGEKDPPLGT